MFRKLLRKLFGWAVPDREGQARPPQTSTVHKPKRSAAPKAKGPRPTNVAGPSSRPRASAPPSETRPGTAPEPPAERATKIGSEPSRLPATKLLSGPCLQFEPPGKTTTDAIIGLDFGTSCTKVVIRLPFVPGGPAFAIPLAAVSASPYLLPSVLDGEGCTANRDPLQNLKVRLMTAPNDPEARARATIHLSRVARRSRAWFLENLSKAYGRYELLWSLNLGVPSSGFRASAMERAFLSCARAAWVLSEHPGTPSMQDARDALERSEDYDGPPVHVIPEIAAAAEGYRRSVVARPGVHVMVDVGATTLDVCAFILKSGAHDNPFGLAVPVVEQLGAAVLHDTRVRALDGCADLGPSCGIDPRDPFAAVPDGLADYVSSAALPSELLGVERRFRNDCELSLRRAIGGMFMKNPIASYRAGVPLFVTGGGGHLSAYRRAIEDIQQRQNVSWHNLLIQKFDPPGDLRFHGSQSVAEWLVNRLRVAYGLSYSPPDYGVFVDANAIPDVEPPPPRRYDDWYVSKDHV